VCELVFWNVSFTLHNAHGVRLNCFVLCISILLDIHGGIGSRTLSPRPWIPKSKAVQVPYVKNVWLAQNFPTASHIPMYSKSSVDDLETYYGVKAMHIVAVLPCMGITRGEVCTCSVQFIPNIFVWMMRFSTSLPASSITTSFYRRHRSTRTSVWFYTVSGMADVAEHFCVLICHLCILRSVTHDFPK
jgi:hypothetical protein